MLGIALGSFMEGFQQGQKIRAGIDEGRQKRAYEGIATETEGAYNKEKAAGRDPGDILGFFRTHAGPQMKMTMLKNGDIAGAKAFDDWSKSADAEQGVKLFGSAMEKAQMGDTEGAFDDAVKAANLKGYMGDHGYKLTGKDKRKAPDGTEYFHISATTPDGKTMEQDVPLDQVSTFISRVANPEAAFAASQKAAEAGTKQAQELDTYKKKKQIDAETGTEKGGMTKKDWLAAYNAKKKDLASSDLSFGKLSAQDQDKRVRDELASAGAFASEQTGGAAPAAPAPAPNIVVDTQTGEQVDPNAVAPNQPTARGGDAQPAQAAPVDNGQGITAPSASGGPKQAIVDKAVTDARSGISLTSIAARLTGAGIDPALWPMEIVNGLQGLRQ
jgi:hypothetical protein